MTITGIPAPRNSFAIARRRAVEGESGSRSLRTVSLSVVIVRCTRALGIAAIRGASSSTPGIRVWSTKRAGWQREITSKQSRVIRYLLSTGT